MTNAWDQIPALSMGQRLIANPTFDKCRLAVIFLRSVFELDATVRALLIMPHRRTVEEEEYMDILNNHEHFRMVYYCASDANVFLGASKNAPIYGN